MSIGKLRKFEELGTFPNVFQGLDLKTSELESVRLAGQWNEYFGNDRPIVAELGCGRGEYTVALAELKPEFNFVGVDIKGARIWKGAKQALERCLNNAAFVRIQVDHLSTVFAPDEISEIWLTFPDPYAKQAKWKKRLTSTRFLNLYQDLLS